MMTCENIQELLSAYLDRELSDADKAEVSAHVDMCARCRAEKEALLSVKESLRSVPMPKLSASVIANIEAETIWKPRWWQTLSFRRRVLPLTVGIATAAAAWAVWRSHSPMLHTPLEIAKPVQPLPAPIAYSAPEKDPSKDNL